jgi:single-stranded-DNA-specific exonuclease
MAAMTTAPARFACPPYSVAAAERLREELGLSRTVAAILVRRGWADPAEARGFLEAADRHDPFAMAGMKEACEAILRHVEARSRIVVYGDYDVDGVCSTAILLRALRALGADPAWELPSRQAEGYGLSAAAVERLAGQGVGLLVTVDCGITAVAEVEAARALGVEVVVTDHHRPGAELPACPVLHPALGGYPFPELCASGVALKLSEALRARAGFDPAGAAEDADLAALATVCDVVPLLGENRRIVREGLRELARTRKPGLRALMRVAAVEPGELDAHALGFRLGPRLNAAGRLRRADPALELLTTGDDRRAAEVAEELDELNRDRREQELRILIEAETACAGQMSRAALVVAGEGWHAGVVGIVASRLVERHHRPCVAIALDGDSGRGSGRSIAPYDLHAGLAACAPHLLRFGGHRMAAGLELHREAVDAFARALGEHAGATLLPADLLPPEPVDALVGGGALGLKLAEELERLEPFGAGNPRPTLLVPGARIGMVTAMGEDRSHARFTVDNGGARARGVAFRTSAASLARLAGKPHDLAVTLEANAWNGTIEPRVVLRSLSPTPGGDCAVLGEDTPFWEAVERELVADPRAFADPPGPPVRALCDRRAEGFAGVAGELLASGEPVLVVAADTARRRDALAALLGGLSDGHLALVSWEAFLRDPSLAAGWPQLVALDPSATPRGEALLAAAPAADGHAFAHLAWGPAESEFALAAARAGLDLRPALVATYRSLRDTEAAGAEVLAAALRGDGRHSRPPEVCGRLLRVLTELGLVAYTPLAGGGPEWQLLESGRTDLGRSPAYRAYAERLAGAESCLGGRLGAPQAAA